MAQLKQLLRNIPEEKGAYLLWLQADRTKRLNLERLGEFDIIPGFYAYLGNAHGHGGLKIGIQHHLSNTTRHWHIDYLIPYTKPIEIWYAIGDRKLERLLAEILQETNKLKTPIPRFGASDYRRSRIPHLFYSKRQLSFQWFEQIISQNFENLTMEQFKI